MREAEWVDVVVVGAGVSGIGTAVHLQQSVPGLTFTMLEARDAIGGTWDLFRYPGVRSDSDVQTYAYAFKPWTNAKAIADGPSIRAYIEETAAERGIDRQIRFGERVLRADWSSSEARCTSTVQRASLDDQSARTTRSPKRICRSMPRSAAVSSM